MLPRVNSVSRVSFLANPTSYVTHTFRLIDECEGLIRIRFTKPTGQMQMPDRLVLGSGEPTEEHASVTHVKI